MIRFAPTPAPLLLGLLLLAAPLATRAHAPVEAPWPAEEAPPALGRPASFGEADLDEETVRVRAGSPLRERPHPRAPRLATVDADSDLPVIERDGGWARVRYGARKAWVLLDASLGGGAARARGAGAADPALLAKAVASLRIAEGGASAGLESLGSWALHTDLDRQRHEDLLRFLDRIAGQVPEAHRERYGIEDEGGTGGEAVIVFAREADYRAFAVEGAALAGLEEGGFAGFGLAALYAEGRSRAELASLLVHELAHLENARRLGPAIPPWLEEGIANDLGYARIGPGGRLDPSGLGGREELRGRVRPGDRVVGDEVIEVTVSARGARAALDRLAEALRRGTIVPLAELTALGWREITVPALRDLAYAESAFFVRFLLDPAGGRAEAFRGHLRSIAAGGPSGADALLDALDEEWVELEPAFHRWLAARAQ